MEQRSRTALPCGILSLSRKRLRGRVSYPSSHLVSLVFLGRHHGWLTLCFFFLAAASVSAAVYCVALTPWKMKEGVFLNRVNRWELVCSERCKIDLAAPLRWALSLELSLFILSVRKSLENEPCRHLLIRFLQWDPSCFLPPDGLINDFFSASMKSSPLNNMQAGPQWHLR